MYDKQNFLRKTKNKMKKLFIAASLFCMFAFSAQTASLTENFLVNIGPFDAATLEINYDIDSQNYYFISKIKTQNVFDKMYHFEAEYLTSGEKKADMFVTKDYQQRTKSARHTRTKSFVFNTDGSIKQRVTTKDGVKKTVDVEQNNKTTDAYDIQTALVMFLQKFKKTQNCTFDKTIFNSKKTYRLTIEDKGPLLFWDENVPLTVKAHKCEAFIRQQTQEKGDLLWQLSAEKSIVFYLAQDTKTKLFYMLKAEIPASTFQDLRVYMTDLKIKE